MFKNLFLIIVCELFYFQSISQNVTVFSDDFETPQTWTIFEEIVSGNTCYANGVGEVTRSTEALQSGANALRVWSNKNGAMKSNHVIAAHTISNSVGITGRYKYGAWIFAASTIGLTQSGPEFSVQSTRTVGNQNLTFIAGVQYIGNQWIADKWNIWHNGTWQTIKFSEFNTTLISNTWYYVELEFDFTTNRYYALSVQGGGINIILDLTQSFQNAAKGFQIGGEARGWSNSVFVTAESENLWTNCAEVRDNKVYYDNISLVSVATLPVELLNFSGEATNIGNKLTWQFADTKDLENVEVQKSREGLEFTRLATLKTESNYLDILDYEITYYRLKMIEKNGEVYFSKIIVLKNKKPDQEIELFPNPVSDILTIKNKGGGSVEIFNAIGQSVLSYAPSQINTQKVDIKELRSGLYFIKLNYSVLPFIKN